MTGASGKILWAASLAFALLLSAPNAAHSQAGYGPGMMPAPEPYRAEFKVTNVRTLADGTTITRESTQIDARDSQGQTLGESIETSPFDPTAKYISAHVWDPADGTDWTWQSRTHEAFVRKDLLPEQRHGCWKSDTGPGAFDFGPPTEPQKLRRDSTQIQRQDLGEDMIDGVEVHGWRTTQTTPKGAIGNDEPLVSVSETWVAPSLGLVLRSVYDDPRTGKITRELVSLDLSEPAPSIFRPPADYRVIHQKMHQVPCSQVQP